MEIYEFLKNESGLPFTIKVSEYEITTKWVDNPIGHYEYFGFTRRRKNRYLSANTDGHLTVTIGTGSHPVEFSFVYDGGEKNKDRVDIDAENFDEFAGIDSPVTIRIKSILENIRDEVRSKSNSNE